MLFMIGLIIRIIIFITGSFKLKCKVELNKNLSCWVWNGFVNKYGEWVNRSLKLYKVLFICEFDMIYLL